MQQALETVRGIQSNMTTAITQEARRASMETHISALRGDLQKWLAELETNAQAQSGDLFPEAPSEHYTRLLHASV